MRERAAAAGSTFFFPFRPPPARQASVAGALARRLPGAVPPAGTAAAALAKLFAAGVSAAEVRRWLGEMAVVPVLTAHPTEVQRRSIQDCEREISNALLLVAAAGSGGAGTATVRGGAPAGGGCARERMRGRARLPEQAGVPTPAPPRLRRSPSSCSPRAARTWKTLRTLPRTRARRLSGRC